MNRARCAYSWVPPHGLVWNVEAGDQWDAVRTIRTVGITAARALGDDCGAVIQDPWTRVVYFLTAPGATKGWVIQNVTACSFTTYIAVPSLTAPPTGLHWLAPPTEARCLTDPELLRHALLFAVHSAFGPRQEADQ